MKLNGLQLKLISQVLPRTEICLLRSLPFYWRLFNIFNTTLIKDIFGIYSEPSDIFNINGAFGKRIEKKQLANGLRNGYKHELKKMCQVDK